jgi:adenine-specific DNA-methyltransferase
METSFQNKLLEILKTDSRFIDQDGELVKAAVIDRAWKSDRDLVKLLISDANIKQKFFDEIEGHWVFNVNTFIDYISDKDFLDNSYTRFRNKIGLNIGGKYLKERGEVCLVWPYKDCVLEGGQTKEEEKRKEVFFNEILAQDEIDRLLDPKVLTNWKRYTADGEKEVSEIRRDEAGVIKENLLIKGNNLLALHCLKQQFMGKVKLIYIDPPYNIGNDDSFGYNDNFNHSAWLTFMKNRLETAWKFLTNDGSIWISIDDRELFYLKVLADEIFDRDNKLSCITVKVKDPAGVGQQSPIFDVCEYLLVYCKDKDAFSASYNSEYTDLVPIDEPISNYKHLITDYGSGELVSTVERKGVGEVQIFQCKDYTIKDARNLSFDEYMKAKNNIAADYNPSGGMILAIRDLIPETGLSYIQYVPIRGKNAGKTTKVYFLNQRILSFLSEITVSNKSGDFKKLKLTNLWSVPNAALHFEGGVDLRSGKKPEQLIQRILDIATNKGDIIFDFHLGSGTTAAVAHKMGRQYIGVEQLDYGKNDGATRLQNVIKGDSSGISKDVNWQGGGEFVYAELMKYNESFIDRISSASSSDELVGTWKDISKDSFLNWYINPETPEDAVNDFIEIGKTDNGLDKQKKLLCELLNKNQLYVNLSEIEDAKFSVSEHDKELNKHFYGEAFNA